MNNTKKSQSYHSSNNQNTTPASVASTAASYVNYSGSGTNNNQANYSNVVQSHKSNGNNGLSSSVSASSLSNRHSIGGGGGGPPPRLNGYNSSGSNQIMGHHHNSNNNHNHHYSNNNGNQSNGSHGHYNERKGSYVSSASSSTLSNLTNSSNNQHHHHHASHGHHQQQQHHHNSNNHHHQQHHHQPLTQSQSFHVNGSNTTGKSFPLQQQSSFEANNKKEISKPLYTGEVNSSRILPSPSNTTLNKNYHSNNNNNNNNSSHDYPNKQAFKTVVNINNSNSSNSEHTKVVELTAQKPNSPPKIQTPNESKHTNINQSTTPTSTTAIPTTTTITTTNQASNDASSSSNLIEKQQSIITKSPSETTESSPLESPSSPKSNALVPSTTSSSSASSPTPTPTPSPPSGAANTASTNSSTLKLTDLVKEKQFYENKEKYNNELIVAVERLYPQEKWPLNNAWTFYNIKANQTVNWLDNVKRIADVEYVEDFWSVAHHIFSPSKMGGFGDLAFFKKGVKPIWEDDVNKNGGGWLHQVPLHNYNKSGPDIDELWRETLLALIGDSFCGRNSSGTVMSEQELDEHGETHLCDFISGAYVTRRAKHDKLTLWTTNYRDEKLTRQIGKIWKSLLNLNDNVTITFEAHETKYSKNNSNLKIAYKE